jgi:hypothetical protein
MNRANGQHPVAIELRREVNFRCPVPGCENVILTFHHFDPPWRERQHNDPAGMIALCLKCHGKAEGNYWTRDELRAMKSNPNPLVALSQPLPKHRARTVYRLGNNYAFGCEAVLRVAEVVLLGSIDRPDGTTAFNLMLLDERNRPQLAIHENSIDADAGQFWDVQFGAHENSFVVRRKRGEVALSLRVRKLTPAELQEMFDEDREREPTAEFWQNVPVELRDRIADHHGAAASGRGEIDKWFDIACKRIRSECVDGDGLIAVIDIDRARMFANGRRLIVRNGAILAGGNLHGCMAFDGQVGFDVPGLPLLNTIWKEMKESFKLDDALIVHREKLLHESQMPAADDANAIGAEAFEKFPALMSTAAALRAMHFVHCGLRVIG